MFIAIDGNSTGRILEKLIFSNDLTKLTQFSTMIQLKIKMMRDVIVDYSGNIIMAGGDNILAEIPSSSCDRIIQEFGSLVIDDYSFSISLSTSVQGVYLGLKYAKAANLRKVEVVFLENGEIEFINLS